MLEIKFNHILNARGIFNHHKFLLDSGFTSHTASNLLNSDTSSFKLEHIERLCRVLICEPNDILIYHPSKKYPIAATHPLNNLIKNENHTVSMEMTLKSLPYKDLINLSNQIQNTVNIQKQKPDNTAEL